MAPQAKKSGKAQKQTKKYIIDASQPASDKIFDVSAFEKFLQDRIKVEGRTNNLGDNVVVKQSGEGKIEITAHNELSGRYLKYLYVSSTSSPRLMKHGDTHQQDANCEQDQEVPQEAAAS
ncbi:Ribosomal protein L22e [Fusarium oxysporum f. sp. vasinfectum]|nr:Ribosomal protein L22e [Fusarium oxysporum f. sp. vasinfectum]KAK2934422.1 Ribosomal protein L22e [Fusarium oxysporum f. sp. vasinfectum]WKT44687.1 Ribosomal protein L22e [Fusarium oxysporum f. sp. vasinfectum]